MRASHLSLIMTLTSLAVVSAGVAGAQTLPWPTDSPRPGGMAAKPAMPAAPATPGAAAQLPGSVAPLGGFSAPPAQPFAGGGGFSAPPAQPFAGGGGAPPPCLIEFTKMREDVEKKGRAAKALSERKPPREELCKQVTVFATAEAKWVKFAEANVATCGIPKEVAQRLKTMHGNTEQTRERICSGGGAAPTAPSLSDALGTVQLPLPETTKSSGGGAFDTLTGNILRR